MDKISKWNTLVVGTGAAGYNAAIRLHNLGVESVAILTEGVNLGTSRNTGSDKQTYYKLGLAGDTPDSVQDMARDLFACGAVDGDNALVEAALSTRCFLHLCECGVPFPTNRYGEYVGYKTDHDPRARATSVGPLTSRAMTEALQKEAEVLHIPVIDHMRVLSLLQDGGNLQGAIGIDTQTGEFRLFSCTNIIYATGGPGNIYADSVYPACHSGGSGALWEAGVIGQNLTHWQYGLSSVSPRWNVSGTYMQALPRFVSVDDAGIEREFLSEYFKDVGELLSTVFLKGYQWPFDARKVLEGSSVIDLLVYRETVMRHRRVYLDFTKNPCGLQTLDLSILSEEARTYLQNAGAAFATPIARLAHMNEPAIDLYRSKGVNLAAQYLEIALCAQHNNGGAKVDLWWQTNVNGLFVCGEAAGTHGISRPGGAALNAGQVGSLRAAQYIAAHRNAMPRGDFPAAEALLARHEAFRRSVLQNPNNVSAWMQRAQKRMSALGGAIRTEEGLQRALAETTRDLAQLPTGCGANDVKGLVAVYRLRDILLSQKMFLFAMSEHLHTFGKTCGSALYYHPSGLLRHDLEECFRFLPDDGKIGETVQEVQMQNGVCSARVRPVRPLPQGGGFFETVWRSFRENGNVE